MLIFLPKTCYLDSHELRSLHGTHSMFRIGSAWLRGVHLRNGGQFKTALHAACKLVSDSRHVQCMRSVCVWFQVCDSQWALLH